MKEFDEQFPELVNRIAKIELRDVYEVAKIFVNGEDFTFSDLYTEDDIQEHCLSKQRFKEAIQKMKERSENRWSDIQIEEFLIMELGL